MTLTQEELEAVVKNHEERLEALERVTGLSATEEPNPREAAHQVLVARIHGEKT